MATGAMEPPEIPPQTRLFPPPRGPSPATVLVLLLGILTVAGFAYGLWVAANSGHGLGTQPGIGVSFSRSSDGLTWNITFTAVPSAFTPSNTYLSLSTAAGGTLLPATPLASLTGNDVPLEGSWGTLYLLYRGQRPGLLLAADSVLIGTTISGTGVSTSGWTAAITANGTTVWTHVLE